MIVVGDTVTTTAMPDVPRRVDSIDSDGRYLLHPVRRGHASRAREVTLAATFELRQALVAASRAERAYSTASYVERDVYLSSALHWVETSAHRGELCDARERIAILDRLRKITMRDIPRG